MKILLSVLLFLIISVNAMAPTTEPKSGTFVLVGGGAFPDEARRLFFQTEGKIVVIPNASGPGDDSYLTKWNGKAVLYTNIEQIRNCNKVWISGGNQLRLWNCFKNTELVNELKNVLSRGGIVGGTSAGASIMGSLMPFEEDSFPGFSLLNMVIDQHFSQRKRLSRLQHIVDKEKLPGIGIDEDTAVIFESNSITVVGAHGATLCLPSSAKPIRYVSGEKIVLTKP